MRKPLPKPEDSHFYASSIAEWVTTTPERDLKALMKVMDAGGYVYALWLVPKPYDAAYDIKNHEPQVPGSVWLGHYMGKRKG